MPKIVDVLSTLGSVPFLGRRMVSYILPRCSQRHKCSRCGSFQEVSLSLLAERPAYTMVEDSQKKLFGPEYEIQGHQCEQDNCNGRVGIHVFSGDATDGSKDELVRLVSVLLNMMPEITGIEPEKVQNFGIEDVYWVD